MKKILLLLVLVPVLSYSQSKRKKREAEEKANAELLDKLKYHVQYLSDDKLEGRRAGSQGEALAMEYITRQYEQMGLEPKGSNGYIQEFIIDEGRQVDAATFLKVDGNTLKIEQDYLPLAFSATKSVKGAPAMSLNEYGQPWFLDLKEILEENRTNPHFDVEEIIKKELITDAAKGATALFVYNTSAIADNVRFNKKDKSAPGNIPVIYLTKEGCRKYFSDSSATLSVELNVGFLEKSRRAHNIVGFINNNAANTVILGAHYDHLGYNEDGNALDTAHVIHNGADDNASGTAALIELARLLKKGAPTGNNYLFINFSGEELGLLGSKYWLEHPSTNVVPNYMINMDMVGRYDTAHKLSVGGYGTSPVWGEVWKGIASDKLVIKLDSTGSGPSDHASFYRRNIPVLFFFTGSHSDYHKATDDWNRINYEGERDIVKMVYDVVSLTDKKGKLAFVKTTEPAMGMTRLTVTLGVMPDYGYTGTGVRIDGVSQGKLAEKTGLHAGDILLQLGDYTFVDVVSYMEVLGKFNKGDKTQLKIRRGNEERVFDILFQ